MIGNVIVKNAEFSINGIASITELSSAIMGRTDIFELPACGASVPVYENITVVSAGTPAEYFEKAEAVLDKEKECVLLHEFDEGFIALTLTSELNSAGYAKLSAYPDNSAADDISLKEAFYKILLSVIEVRYYMDFDTEKYRNLFFEAFPCRRIVKAKGIRIEAVETEKHIVLPFKSDYFLVPVSFLCESDLSEKLNELKERSVKSSLGDISVLAIAELDNRREDEKTIVFCVRDLFMLCEQADMVLSQKESFLRSGFTWKTPSGSFFVNAEAPAKIAFCNPPAGMYNRESFFRLYTKLNGIARNEDLSSYNVVKSDNDMSDRYLYEAINTYVLVRMLSGAGISADYLSGGSMGEISYSINKTIAKSRNRKNVTEAFEVIQKVLADMFTRQYELAEKYFCRKVNDWAKYYVQCDADKLQEIINDYENVFIIIIGSPRDIMVCGEESACNEVFDKVKCVAVKLDEPFFIHTPVLDLERENIIAQIVREGIYADPPEGYGELFSTASCTHYVPEPEWYAKNMADILTEPVNYCEAVRKMYDLGTRIFIDISTGQICRKWVRETLSNKEDTVVASVFSKENDCTDLVKLAAKLISYRTRFDFRRFFGMFGYDIPKAEALPKKKENNVSAPLQSCVQSSIEAIIEKQLENNARAYKIYTECQNEIYRKLLLSMNTEKKPKKNCLFDRTEILEMTDGSLSAVLGEKYREADLYPVRARMPLPPFLFADRIIKIDAEFGKLRPSEIVTEYDIPSNCVFRTGERSVSSLVMSESAHVGIFLMSYIGIDIISKGTLAFRAVDTSERIVSDRVPCVGDTMKTVFRIDKFMQNGMTTLLFYTCENYLNNELVNMKNTLASAEYPIIYINNNDGKAEITTEKTTRSVYAVPIITAGDLGDSSFKKTYGTKYCYYAGAMANGIASAEMVIALGKSGFMGSYGSGGLSLERISADIDKIQSALSHGEPYMINMLSSRNADAEWKLARLFIEKNVHADEASAFIMLFEPLVYYRLHGLTENKDGSVNIPNKVIAKISREEILRLFSMPPDKKIVDSLLKKGIITETEAVLSQRIPMADDITVEADSGGHTDGRPLISSGSY